MRDEMEKRRSSVGLLLSSPLWLPSLPCGHGMGIQEWSPPAVDTPAPSAGCHLPRGSDASATTPQQVCGRAGGGGGEACTRPVAATTCTAALLSWLLGVRAHGAAKRSGAARGSPAAALFRVEGENRGQKNKARLEGKQGLGDRDFTWSCTFSLPFPLRKETGDLFFRWWRYVVYVKVKIFLQSPG